jgi:hypothetical protein
MNALRKRTTNLLARTAIAVMKTKTKSARAIAIGGAMRNEQEALREAANDLVRVRREISLEDGEYCSPAWKMVMHALQQVERIAAKEWKERYEH